jgi:hypothetical protein
MALSIDRLRDALTHETAAGRGTLLESLSPYGVVVQTLVNREKECFLRLFVDQGSAVRILLSDEIALPPDIPAGGSERLVRM